MPGPLTVSQRRRTLGIAGVRFLTAGCPCCHPNNTVRALNKRANSYTENTIKQSCMYYDISFVLYLLDSNSKNELIRGWKVYAEKHNFCNSPETSRYYSQCGKKRKWTEKST